MRALLLLLLPHTLAQYTTLGSSSVLTGTGVAGAVDGPAGTAQLGSVWGAKYDPVFGVLWLCDKSNGRIRRVQLSNGSTATLLGSGAAALAPVLGVGTAAQFKLMFDLAVTPQGTGLYVSDEGAHVIMYANVSTRALVHVSGGGPSRNASGTALGAANAAAFNAPRGLVFVDSGATLAVADSANNRILLLAVSTGATSLLAGSATGLGGAANGLGSAARFFGPRGLALDAAGGRLFVADSANHKLRAVALVSGAVTDVVGGGPGAASGRAAGVGTSALFGTLFGLWALPQNDTLLVVDGGNNGVRACTLSNASCGLMRVGGSTGWG